MCENTYNGVDAKVAEASSITEFDLREDTGIPKRRLELNRQVAALPIRRDASGDLQVLLVTSRETCRWVIPKGWPWSDRADHLAAGEEAWEEAGVRGTLDPDVIGTFHYDKRRRNDMLPITVSVYLLTVETISDKWPESHERKRAWFSVAEAAQSIEEPELRAIILAAR